MEVMMVSLRPWTAGRSVTRSSNASDLSRELTAARLARQSTQTPTVHPAISARREEIYDTMAAQCAAPLQRPRAPAGVPIARIVEQRLRNSLRRRCTRERDEHQSRRRREQGLAEG